MGETRGTDSTVFEGVLSLWGHGHQVGFQSSQDGCCVDKIFSGPCQKATAGFCIFSMLLFIIFVPLSILINCKTVDL